MKRLRFGEEGGEVESINMANVLMLLSSGQGTVHRSAVAGPGRVFECKTCNRKFSSFQALGGHRASHKRPRLLGDGQGLAKGQGELGKTRVHECSICGLEFAIGQALGGHMRRHRATTTAGFGDGGVEIKKPARKTTLLWLDLNSPPLEDEAECRKLGLSLEFVDKLPWWISASSDVA